MYLSVFLEAVFSSNILFLYLVAVYIHFKQKTAVLSMLYILKQEILTTNMFFRLNLLCLKLCLASKLG